VTKIAAFTACRVRSSSSPHVGGSAHRQARSLAAYTDRLQTDNRRMTPTGLLWVNVDGSEELTRVTDAQPGQKIVFSNGTPCVVDRIEPPPAGAHVVQGTIHAH
jgi:hypothetical protein